MDGGGGGGCCNGIIADCPDKHPKAHGNRKLSAADDSIYDVLIQLCKGQSLPPKCARSKPQKATVIHFWRGRGEFSVKVENGKHYQYYDDQKVAEKIRNQRHCSKRMTPLQRSWCEKKCIIL